MARRNLSLLFVAFAAIAAMLVQAQNPTTQPSTASGLVMPTDSTEFMRLAARVNGLDSASMKPWHLKATYQISDDEGKNKDQGTFEEWWAGSEKYRISYASTRFSQVRYQNGSDTRMTGDARWAPATEAMVEQYLVHPLPYPSYKPYLLNGEPVDFETQLNVIFQLDQR